jgi:hypothetical protein
VVHWIILVVVLVDVVLFPLLLHEQCLRFLFYQGLLHWEVSVVVVDLMAVAVGLVDLLVVAVSVVAVELMAVAVGLVDLLVVAVGLVDLLVVAVSVVAVDLNAVAVGLVDLLVVAVSVVAVDLIAVVVVAVAVLMAVEEWVLLGEQVDLGELLLVGLAVIWVGLNCY